MEQEYQFRDAFNPEVVSYISSRLSAVYDTFDAELFERMALEGMGELSFLDRARNIVAALEVTLPSRFEEAARVLVDTLGPERVEEALNGFEGFYIMPLCMYVSRHGLEAPDVSLNALYEMTKRFTAEGDIRPFIEKYPGKTMAFLEKLTRDPSPYARRLASEGTRPRLPLSGRLAAFQKDPAPVIELLDRLYRDPNLMVRRSVANNINDISKDNPEAAVAALKRWKKEAPGDELDWMIRHGLRTLIKQNHPGALELLGFETFGLQVNGWNMTPDRIRLGDSLSFAFRIRSTADRPQNLALNYVIHFVKANGRTRPKVFRLPNKTLEARESLLIEKTHKFLPYKNQSFYSGEHFLEVTVNGEHHFRTPFRLVVPGDGD